MKPMKQTSGVNYGSLRIIDEDTEADDGESSENIFGQQQQQPQQQSRRRPPPRDRESLRSQLDNWLRRDFSITSGLGLGSRRDLSTVTLAGDSFSTLSSISSAGNSSRAPSTYGRSRSSRSSSIIFGPTDRSIEAIVKDVDRAGLQYKSVDRSLIDTTVWHQRKVALLQRRVKAAAAATGAKNKENASSHSLRENSGLEPSEMDYKFDLKAVSRLQNERWIFDKILVAGIGICMAITGLAVSRAADTLLELKLVAALDRFENGGNFVSGLLFHVGISALFAFGAFIPVAYCPVSAGSGIAEAKAILNGVIIPNCTSLLTALCKGCSVILSVSASLPAGLEGPMIHLGLCIGENANRWVPKKYQVLDPLRTERSRLDYTAIGTAAGVAAAFRAPISGILFAMEEGASFWSTHLSWRCFLSACCTVIAMYCIISFSSNVFYVTSMDLFNGIDRGSHQSVIPAQVVPRFNLWEYGVFVVVGGLGGLIGAIFCVCNRKIAVLRRSIAMGMRLKALEVIFIATVYAALAWILPSLPYLSKCGNIEERRMGAHYYRRFDCPEGHYNEMATLLLNLGGKGITLLFQEDDDDAFSIATCLAAGFVQVITLCFAFGVSVSAGIFIPLLFIGSCFGRALALIVGLDPRTYAIVGAAACLGGVVRVLISLTAIVTSTTSLSFFMTPIMVATLMAQTVGNWISKRPGIYDIILQLRDVPFLEEEPPEAARHANIRARNIMKTSVVTLGTQVKVSDLLVTLKKYGFSEFPVIDRDAAGNGDGILVGSISRIDLLALLSQPDIFFTDEEEQVGASSAITKEKALSFAALDRLRPKKLPTNADDVGKQLSTEDKEKYLHLSPYLQIAPHTFDGHGSAERAYEMFRSLGLRSLLVVDKRFRPIGVITRHELILLEEVGHDHHKIEEKTMQAALYTSTSDLKNQFE